ncbi:GAF domain-containing sensor histidine kinase [Patescibacteria group bacterium]|nr:GAF domain-containing sensor histidine kinase [Patescibacteria group bacterium]
MAQPAQKNTKAQNKQTENLIEKNRALEATYKLFEIVLESLEFQEMSQKIADIIPQTLGYETGVLALVDEDKEKLIRVAISQTPGGETALGNLERPFKEIVIPLNHLENYCIKSMRDKKQYITRNLYDVVRPAISKENAEFVQKLMGTSISIVNPLIAHGKSIGIIIASMSKNPEELSPFEKEMITRFSQSVGIVLEHSKLYTELKRAKEALNKAYDKLRELDKAKDDFLSVASHELRTPMTIIKSYIWMLQSGKYGELNNNQKKYADTAMKSTDRLINLVNDMLNISRIEQGRMEFKIEALDFCENIRELIEGFRIQAEEKHIYIKIEKDCDETDVSADPTKLKEIITNLLGNALKFTNKGGIIIKLTDIGNYIQTSIIDTGVGIGAQDIPVLFKKFGRLDNSYTKVAESGGTGLGLHIVKLYTELMGGNVGVYSEGKGKGSTFWFTLPKYKGKYKRTKKEEESKSHVQDKISTII